MLVMKLYWQSEFLQKGSSIGIHSSHRVVADFRAVIYSFADNLIYDIYIKCLQTAFWSLLLYTERHFLLLPILFLMKICLVFFLLIYFSPYVQKCVHVNRVGGSCVRIPKINIRYFSSDSIFSHIILRQNLIWSGTHLLGTACQPVTDLPFCLLSLGITTTYIIAALFFM